MVPDTAAVFRKALTQSKSGTHELFGTQFLNNVYSIRSSCAFRKSQNRARKTSNSRYVIIRAKYSAQSKPAMEAPSDILRHVRFQAESCPIWASNRTFSYRSSRSTAYQPGQRLRLHHQLEHVQYFYTLRLAPIPT